MTRCCRRALFALFVSIILWLPNSSTAKDDWKQVSDGLFLADLTVENTSDGSPLKITILKIDPGKHAFRLLCASEHDNQSLGVKEWAQKFGLIAAINAGMYHKDGYTSVGYMKNHEHVNNSHINHYKAVLAFNPIDPELPPIQIIDRDCQNFETLKSKYRSLFQGIRMISCTGKNVWKQQPEKWSTAAVGMDKDGNALFIFCETPTSVHDLIEALLSLPLSVHNAMYLEGGPPASFYLSENGVEVERAGQKGFKLVGTIPNVLGVVKIQ